MAKNPAYAHSDLDEITIYHSRWKMGLVAFGAFVFVAAAVPILYWGFRQGGSTLAFSLLLAIIDILFFGLCLFYAVRRMRASSPALVLGREGIYDDASISGAGFIPWNEIALIYTAQIHFQRFLCLVPKDIDAFLQRQPIWKRRLMRMNMGLVGAPITISATALTISLDELQQRIQVHLRTDNIIRSCRQT